MFSNFSFSILSFSGIALSCAAGLLCMSMSMFFFTQSFGHCLRFTGYKGLCCSLHIQIQLSGYFPLERSLPTPTPSPPTPLPKNQFAKKLSGNGGYPPGPQKCFYIPRHRISAKSAPQKHVTATKLNLRQNCINQERNNVNVNNEE